MLHKKLLMIFLVSFLVSSIKEVKGIEISNCSILDDAGSYSLTADISNYPNTTCMNITADNVTLDLQGHTIDGINSNQVGIYTNRFNSTIKDGTVRNFQTGIYLDRATNCTVINVTSSNHQHEWSAGIRFNQVNYSLIKNVTMNDNVFGIDFGYNSYYNTIEGVRGNIEDGSGKNLIQCGHPGMGAACDGAGSMYNLIKDVSGGDLWICHGCGYNVFSNITTTGFHFGGHHCNLTNSTIFPDSTWGYALSIDYGGYNTVYDSIIIGQLDFRQSKYNRFYNNIFNSTSIDWRGWPSSSYPVYWYVERQPGHRIIYSENYSEIGGNYWTNSAGTGFSDLCEDLDYDGFCDDSYNPGNGKDNLPLARPKINITISLPDLTLSSEDVSYPLSNFTVGQPVTVKSTIHNMGNEVVTDVIVQFFDNELIGNETIDSIAPRENGTVRVDWVPTCNSTNLLVNVDPYNSINESNETNNDVNLTTPVGEQQRLLEKLNSYPDFHFYEEYYDYDDDAPGSDEEKESICDLDDDDIWMCSVYPISLKFMSGPHLTTGLDSNTWYEGPDPSNRTSIEFEFNLSDIIGDEIKDFLKKAEFYLDFSGMPAYSPIYWDGFDERAEILQKPEVYVSIPSLPRIYASGDAYIYYLPVSDDINFTGIEQIDVGLEEELFSIDKEKSWNFWILKLNCSLTTSGRISARTGIKLPSTGLVPDGIAPAGKIVVDADGNVYLIVEDESYFDEPPTLDVDVALNGSPYILVEGVLATKDFGPGDYIRSPYDWNVVYRDLLELDPVLRVKLDKIAVNIDGNLTVDLIGMPPMTKNISKTITLFDGYESVLGHTTITTYSPVNLHVYDSMGRHVGFNATGIKQEIPYSNFTVVDGISTITLPSFTNKFVVVVNGTGNSTYDIKLRKIISLTDSNGTNVITYINFNLTDVFTEENDIDYFDFNFDEIEDRIRREMYNETYVSSIKKVMDSLDFDADGIPDTLDDNLTFDKFHTSLFTEYVTGGLNERILLSAKLLSLDKKLSNKNISFFVDGDFIGSNLTDEGNVSLNYIIPPNMSIGTHQLTMIFYGDDEYSESRVNVSLIVVDYSPRVKITNPQEYSRINGVVNITGEIIDENLDLITLKIDDVVVSNSLPYAWNTTEYHDGPHVIELSALDESSNENSTVILIFVDNTPPEARISYDPYSADLVIEGLDDVVNVSYDDVCLEKVKHRWWFYEYETCVKEGRVYNLTDDAGNEMFLKMAYSRNSVVTRTKIQLISVEYYVAGDKIHEVEYEHNSASYKTTKKSGEIKKFFELIFIHQSLTLANYNARKDETKIIDRDGRKVLEGLHVVDILTDMKEGLRTEIT